MLTNSQRVNINRMINGESLIRIGDVWYGDDENTTVTGIFHPSQKNIETLVPIRAEAAVSFSNTRPGVNMFVVEMIVHSSVFQSKIARLQASVQITNVLPIINRDIAALCQPIPRFRELYNAFGFKEIDENSPESDQQKAYSSVPVMVNIDSVEISTIPGHPKNIKLTVNMIKILTSTFYGDKPLYTRSVTDSIHQEAYIERILKHGGDTPAIDATASVFGIDSGKLRDTIEQMSRPPWDMASPIKETVRDVKFKEILDTDLYLVEVNGEDRIVKLYGVDGYISSGMWSEITMDIHDVPGKLSTINKLKQSHFGYIGTQAIYGTDKIYRTETQVLRAVSNLFSYLPTNRFPYAVRVRDAFSDIEREDNKTVKEGEFLPVTLNIYKTGNSYLKYTNVIYASINNYYGMDISRILLDIGIVVNAHYDETIQADYTDRETYYRQFNQSTLFEGRSLAQSKKLITKLFSLNQVHSDSLVIDDIEEQEEED